MNYWSKPAIHRVDVVLTFQPPYPCKYLLSTNVRYPPPPVHYAGSTASVHTWHSFPVALLSLLSCFWCLLRVKMYWNSSTSAAPPWHIISSALGSSKATVLCKKDYLFPQYIVENGPDRRKVPWTQRTADSWLAERAMTAGWA